MAHQRESQPNKLLIILIAAAAVLAGIGYFLLPSQSQKTVRVVYLIPRDREFNSEYETAIEFCLKDLRGWYAKHMNGKTFQLSDPVVEVVHSTQNAQWFNTHMPANRPEERHYTTYNAYNLVESTLGNHAGQARLPGLTDSETVWLIYVDAPGGTGAGTKGFAVLPDHDLIGLAGKSPEQPSIKRWIGGSGHELGHAFGLFHPKPEQPVALMDKGYGIYPECNLTETDVSILDASPFFNQPKTVYFTPARIAVISIFAALVLWLMMRFRFSWQGKFRIYNTVGGTGSASE